MLLGTFCNDCLEIFFPKSSVLLMRTLKFVLVFGLYFHKLFIYCTALLSVSGIPGKVYIASFVDCKSFILSISVNYTEYIYMYIFIYLYYIKFTYVFSSTI